MNGRKKYTYTVSLESEAGGSTFYPVDVYWSPDWENVSQEVGNTARAELQARDKLAYRVVGISEGA